MKTGLNYYTIDTDRYQDRRIKRLKKDFGCQGIAVYDYILCEIYRVRGCVLEWDANTAFDVAEYFGLKESVVCEIVKYCGVVGLFDKELLAGGIVTSASILRRYLEMCKRAKRQNIAIPEELQKFREELQEIPEELQKTPEVFTQSKVKYNITTTSTTNAHTREEDFAHSDEDPYGTGLAPKEKSCAKKESPLPSGTWVASEHLAEVLLNDSRWMASVSANKGHPIEELQSLVKEFCTNILLTDDGKELSDAKKHFINWLRKRPKNNEQQQTHQRPTRPYRNPEPDFEGIKAFVARGIASAKPPQ